MRRGATIWNIHGLIYRPRGCVMLRTISRAPNEKGATIWNIHGLLYRPRGCAMLRTISNLDTILVRARK